MAPLTRPVTLAGLALTALVTLAPPVAAFDLKRPRLTRQQMESSLAEGESWRFVYGTLDPRFTPLLRERAMIVARRLFGLDSSQVVADRALSEAECARHPLFLIGGPRQNDWTRRLAPGLPVEFIASGFRWAGTEYDRPGDCLHLVYPHPLEPRFFLLLLAGNSPAAMTNRGGGFFFGGEDWRIYRDGALARSGNFAQTASHPWGYDPALDRDRERERERFTASLRDQGAAALRVLTPPDLIAGPGVRVAGEALLARLDRMGLSAGVSPPISITLYHSLEEKGVLVHDTRPENLDALLGAHLALPAGWQALDLWSVAALRLRRLGAAASSPWLEPAAVWLAGRFEGEPLGAEVSRLYFGRLLPTAREAATRPTAWRSPLIWTPARALLAHAIFESAVGSGRRPLLALLRDSPAGTLDSLCASAGVSAPRVERRYMALADSLARAGRAGIEHPRPWRPADGFQRGVCLAHAVSLERGYLSAACARELASLHAMGIDWISLTPFGYLPSLKTPEIYPSAEGGPDEENDESVCEAAARARTLGMRVWLKPHLWSRGWIGELEFTPPDWPRFFERYREFILHYALLAERERIDGLFVGHELVSATQRAPEKWRELIADVRRVYGGTITYAANWDEVSHVGFWDALDLISVSFYSPLAAAPTRDVPELERGAAKALASLRELAERVHRPVLLSELGYPPRGVAPVRPWEEGKGPPDLETQRACYEAIVRALERQSWVAGAFWWKWFTASEIGGPADASYTPRGKPAQLVMVRALARWKDRTVSVPGSTRSPRSP